MPVLARAPPWALMPAPCQPLPVRLREFRRTLKRQYAKLLVTLQVRGAVPAAVPVCAPVRALLTRRGAPIGVRDRRSWHSLRGDQPDGCPPLHCAVHAGATGLAFVGASGAPHELTPRGPRVLTTGGIIATRQLGVGVWRQIRGQNAAIRAGRTLRFARSARRGAGRARRRPGERRQIVRRRRQRRHRLRRIRGHPRSTRRWR